MGAQELCEHITLVPVLTLLGIVLGDEFGEDVPGDAAAPGPEDGEGGDEAGGGQPDDKS